MEKQKRELAAVVVAVVVALVLGVVWYVSWVMPHDRYMDAVFECMRGDPQAYGACTERVKNQDIGPG